MSSRTTIDNLPPEASKRYAVDQELYAKDRALIKEAPAVAGQASISATTLTFSSALDQLLQTTPTHAEWASFHPPEGFFSQRTQIFSFQLIPSMGSEDRRESQSEKILAKLEALKTEAPATLSYEELRQKEESEKENTILVTLLKQLHKGDTDLIAINAARGQYQKG
ncbi:MAG: DUF5399 family protein [Verrucomicrobia bacterium]|nr:DUF5399 family protein [Verrucomicrobiota bacterium]